VDLLTSGTTFASIVGLLCNFKSEKRALSDNEYQEFVSWLDANRHKRLLEEITSNHLLGLGIKSLLNQNHDDVLKKLADLDDTLLVLSSSISGFKEISHALAPNIELSEQAISILSQLRSSGSESLIELNGFSSPQFMFSHTTGNIKFTEKVFIEDDLSELVKRDLLLLNINSSGGRVYKFTRLAERLLKQI